MAFALRSPIVPQSHLILSRFLWIEEAKPTIHAGFYVSRFLCFLTSAGIIHPFAHDTTLGPPPSFLAKINWQLAQEWQVLRECRQPFASQNPHHRHCPSVHFHSLNNSRRRRQKRKVEVGPGRHQNCLNPISANTPPTHSQLLHAKRHSGHSPLATSIIVGWLAALLGTGAAEGKEWRSSSSSCCSSLHLIPLTRRRTPIAIGSSFFAEFAPGNRFCPAVASSTGERPSANAKTNNQVCVRVPRAVAEGIPSLHCPAASLIFPPAHCLGSFPPPAGAIHCPPLRTPAEQNLANDAKNGPMDCLCPHGQQGDDCCWPPRVKECTKFFSLWVDRGSRKLANP